MFKSCSTVKWILLIGTAMTKPLKYVWGPVRIFLFRNTHYISFEFEDFKEIKGSPEFQTKL